MTPEQSVRCEGLADIAERRAVQRPVPVLALIGCALVVLIWGVGLGASVQWIWARIVG